MSASMLFIVLPIAIGVILLTVDDTSRAAFAAAGACVFLALLAVAIPIDTPASFLGLSYKFASTSSFLGRPLVLPSEISPLLAILYGLCAFWFFGSAAAGIGERLVPFGMIITGLMVAAMAVQPFLYAALIVELAVLIAVPMLAGRINKPSPGILRFLIYETLGFPFLLVAGWLLAGLETSAGDLGLTMMATVMLGLGFALLLGVFPLNEWIPQLMEEQHPYTVGFLIWLLPSIFSVLALSFLNNYAWIRSSAEVHEGLRVIGLTTLMAGALLALLNRHLGRVMAYSAVAETGFQMLALSMVATQRSWFVFMFIIPRGVTFGLWAMALSVIRSRTGSLLLSDVRGIGRAFPLVTAALLISNLSAAGLPLLAGFLPRAGVWMGMSQISVGSSVVLLLAMICLLISALRQLSVLTASLPELPWQVKEPVFEQVLISLGIAIIILLGVFPRATDFVVAQLPGLFERLAP